MKRLASAAVLLVLSALTGVAGAETDVAPSVWVVAPANGTATNGAALEAVVGFRALGNVTQIGLEANGSEVARRANPPQRKTGEERFTVDLSGLAEGAQPASRVTFLKRSISGVVL